nr:hypothetical protein CFP56_60706 [Quercus suber]
MSNQEPKRQNVGDCAQATEYAARCIGRSIALDDVHFCAWALVASPLCSTSDISLSDIGGSDDTVLLKQSLYNNGTVQRKVIPIPEMPVKRYRLQPVLGSPNMLKARIQREIAAHLSCGMLVRVDRCTCPRRLADSKILLATWDCGVTIQYPVLQPSCAPNPSIATTSARHANPGHFPFDKRTPRSCGSFRFARVNLQMAITFAISAARSEKFHPESDGEEEEQTFVCVCIDGPERLIIRDQSERTPYMSRSRRSESLRGADIV